MEDKETDGRNWCFTKNNPKETDNQFDEYLKSLKHIRAFVFQRERGENGTEHFQGYAEFHRSMRFSTMRKFLAGAHIEHRKGTKQQAVDYCKKEETRIGKVYEYGDIIEERERTDIEKIIDLLNEGADDAEIRQAFPVQFLKMKNAIEGYRQQVLTEQQEKNIRVLEVVYVHSKPDFYRSRRILEKLGLENVYNVRFYDNRAWDKYQGQDIVLFDRYRSNAEYRSNADSDSYRSGFSFDTLLHYLNGLPISLPCRYNDKTACYTKVYIVSDITLDQQYADIKHREPERWEQLSNRICRVYDFDSNSQEYAFYNDDSSHSLYKTLTGITELEKKMAETAAIARRNTSAANVEWLSEEERKAKVAVAYHEPVYQREDKRLYRKR